MSARRGEYARSAAELPDRSELFRLYHGDPGRGVAPHTLAEIRQHYGVATRTIYRWLEVLEIPPRRRHA